MRTGWWVNTSTDGKSYIVREFPVRRFAEKVGDRLEQSGNGREQYREAFLYFRRAIFTNHDLVHAQLISFHNKDGKGTITYEYKFQPNGVPYDG